MTMLKICFYRALMLNCIILSIYIVYIFIFVSVIIHLYNHSHKNWKDSLETMGCTGSIRAALLIFWLGLEISGVAMDSIHQKSKKWRLQCRIAQWKWLRLFYPLSVVMTMVPRLLRQLRRSLQIKKSITNAPCLLDNLLNSQNIPKVAFRTHFLLSALLLFFVFS